MEAVVYSYDSLSIGAQIASMHPRTHTHIYIHSENKRVFGFLRFQRGKERVIGALKSLHVVFKQMSLLYFKLRINFVQEVVSIWLKEQNISVSVDTSVPFQDYHYLYICVCVCALVF